MQAPVLVFRPERKLTLAAALALPVLLSLGLWQLDRARQLQQRWEQQRAVEAGEAQPVREAMPLPPSAQALVAHGHYDHPHSILLDNRLRNGRFGHEVLTPFRLAGSGEHAPALLVNRGWIEGDPARRWLPEIEPIPGQVALRGRAWQPAPRRVAAVLPDQQSWPLVAQWSDLDRLAQRLGHPLLPFVLRLEAGSPGALDVHWPRATRSPARHVAYAVQWFGLAAVLVLAWLLASSNAWAWLQARRRRSP